MRSLSSAQSGFPVQADPLVDALLAARLHDPFSLLGLHRIGEGWRLRVFDPHAEAVWLRLASGLEPLGRAHPAGLFEWCGAEPPIAPYVLGVSAGGQVREIHDPTLSCRR
jgi:1,4-alpha-glucan branching enzyme